MLLRPQREYRSEEAVQTSPGLKPDANRERLSRSTILGSLYYTYRQYDAMYNDQGLSVSLPPSQHL